MRYTLYNPEVTDSSERPPKDHLEELFNFPYKLIQPSGKFMLFFSKIYCSDYIVEGSILVDQQNPTRCQWTAYKHDGQGGELVGITFDNYDDARKRVFNKDETKD